MTREQLEKIFDNDETQWEGDNAFQGLQILSKYTDNLIQAAEHDIIFSEGIEKVLDAGLTEEDADALRKLNWMLDGHGCFSCFV
jgi:hypothetical protein